MKTPVLLVSLVIASCLLGCSKSGSSAGKKGIVPATAAEIIASPQFKLEHTTKSGIKCYTRPVTPEEYRNISDEGRDHEYVTGDERFAFFLVPIRDGKIIELTTEEAFEITGFVLGKTMAEDKQMQEMLKQVGAPK